VFLFEAELPHPVMLMHLFSAKHFVTFVITLVIKDLIIEG